MAHSSPIARGRIFGCVILIASFGSAIYFGVGAWKWNSDFYAWVDARPMQLIVDLTMPATHSTPFEQTCPMAHGQSIYVAFDLPDATEENMGKHFAGLEGAITIRDVSGREVLTKQFDADSVRFWGDDPMLVGFHPFSTGDYTAEIKIEKGAVALAGTKHELYARNELCGLELMPAYVLGAISAVASLIGCFVACYTVPSVLRDGFRTQDARMAERKRDARRPSVE